MNTPRAAVALVRVTDPEPVFLIIRRAHNPNDPWSGHFSLPGGRCEAEDADLLETCIRETREEVGIELNRDWLDKTLPLAFAGSLLGRHTPVQPFLFSLKERPSVFPQATEVSEVHWLAESFLKNPQSHVRAHVLQQIPDKLMPGIPLSGYWIWGFTYGILGDFFGGFPDI